MNEPSQYEFEKFILIKVKESELSMTDQFIFARFKSEIVRVIRPAHKGIVSNMWIVKNILTGQHKRVNADNLKPVRKPLELKQPLKVEIL